MFCVGYYDVLFAKYMLHIVANMSQQNNNKKPFQLPTLSLACTRKYIFVIIGVVITLAILFILQGGHHRTLLQMWHKGPLYTVTFISTDMRATHKKGHKELKCYNYGHPILKDIQKEPHPPKLNSIFFLDTSCHSHTVRKIAILKRHACSVESAARSHPKRTIYLLYASPGVLKNAQSESDLMLRVLSNFNNIKILHVNVTKFLKDTPLEKWYANGKLRFSNDEGEHTSALMRLVALWRYGGIFVDSDVMVLKSLDGLAPNFAVAADSDTISESVLGFAKDGKGHEFLEACLHDFMTNFTTRSKNPNGLETLTRIAKDICHTNNTNEMDKAACNGGIEIYPTADFLPVKRDLWRQKLFDPDATGITTKELEKSYTVRVYEKESATVRIPLDSTAPYLNLAKNYCPKIMRYCKGYL